MEIDVEVLVKGGWNFLEFVDGFYDTGFGGWVLMKGGGGLEETGGG